MHLKKPRDIQKERRQDRKKGQGGRKKKKYFPSSPLQIGYCSVSLALYTCHLSCYIGPATFLLYARWLIHHLAGPRGTSCGIRQERRFSAVFGLIFIIVLLFFFLFFWGCRFIDCFFVFIFLAIALPLSCVSRSLIYRCFSFFLFIVVFCVLAIGYRCILFLGYALFPGHLFVVVFRLLVVKSFV